MFLKNAMNFSVLSLNADRVLLQKIYFPRMFIPLVPIVVYFPNFVIQLVLSIILISVFGFFPNLNFLWVFLIFPIMILFSCSIGLLVSTFVVQFRDLELIWKYLMQFLVYLLPVAYPISIVPEKWLHIYELNPVVPLIQSFRYALIGGELPLVGLLYSGVFSLILFFFSSLLFRMREPTIVDAL